MSAFETQWRFLCAENMEKPMHITKSLHEEYFPDFDSEREAAVALAESNYFDGSSEPLILVKIYHPVY